MKKTIQTVIELTEDDLKQLLCREYKANEEQITFQINETKTGYGRWTKREYELTSVVIVKEELCKEKERKV